MLTPLKKKKLTRKKKRKEKEKNASVKCHEGIERLKNNPIKRQNSIEGKNKRGF